MLYNIVQEIMDDEIKTVDNLKGRKYWTGNHNKILIEADNTTTNTYKTPFHWLISLWRYPKSVPTRRSLLNLQQQRTEGKCENERGITLTSNMHKIFESVINKRSKPKVNITILALWYKDAK